MDTFYLLLSLLILSFILHVRYYARYMKVCKYEPLTFFFLTV